MKVAVIGSGGREHAIVKRLRQSPDVSELVVLPGNGGIAADALCVDIKATDVDGVVAWCAENGVGYVVVTPDDPLALGMVDALAAAGIPAFGPTAAAARIEASKVFAKALMQKAGIPTAAWAAFSELGAALAYLDEYDTYPVVVKADGLALGKGVTICDDRAAAVAALREAMEQRVFGDAGASVVIEEFLFGPEVSVLAFCDGETLVPMAASMDHKPAYDGNFGPNTGGMGAIAPNPFYTEEVAAACLQQIFLPTVAAMQAEGAPFKGCLYFGLMLTQKGPYVIEYNCRFGDPETQVVLPLLQGDLLAIMRACTEGRLTPDMVGRRAGAAACVVMASGGYPGTYQTGYEVDGLAAAARPGVEIVHAGTRAEEGRLVTAGGRVLGVTAVGGDLAAAVQGAYAAVEQIRFTDAHYRRDIGAVALRKA